MSWKIPLFKIYWDEEDIKAVNEIIRSGMNWAEGSCIEELEKKISEYAGCKYCVVFNSGTSVLHALLMAYDIGAGDEVIVPSFTFISTANAPLFTGAKPVFADIEKETFGLDPIDVQKKITLKTKAIIPIHYGGCPCKIKELQQIAKRYNLLLLEDAAESFGAMVQNKKIGTFGNAAMFSFCQNKIITTGEGGAAVINSKRIYEKLKLIRSHGRLCSGKYFSFEKHLDYVMLGYNFRIPSFVAALGISQLKKIDKIIAMRRENARILDIKLSKIKEITILNYPKNYSHVYQMYTTIVNKDRDGLKSYLASKGIMTKVYFHPVHLTKFYRQKYGKICKLPLTEYASKHVLSLPMYPALKIDEIEYIVKTIKNYFEE